VSEVRKLLLKVLIRRSPQTDGQAELTWVAVPAYWR